jgi:hypothetical protein
MTGRQVIQQATGGFIKQRQVILDSRGGYFVADVLIDG